MDILTQRRITDLISELDTLGLINATVESKGRYGKMKSVTVHMPLYQAKEVLLEDFRLKPLVDFKISVFKRCLTEISLFLGFFLNMSYDIFLNMSY
ncbi:hypothetical protein DU80_07445 [Methanosarcina mazei]|jgi:cell division control protein 6|uniref:Cdc6 C-terminal domain-containing protein n=1 Tax=Methanosarcina mazei TaxID=2209 RepID=A0A0F8GF76_METMZ|nr:hypothetical protein DU47_00960 [Methanosarcina mazei]KKG53444.1 hypothetical protein DU33_06060 [Methanosarcina mazei]KKG57853.1 hypothetical protein DU45_03215 [Methanosarcina mazei]KKG66887.1 hypothetical protein DU64_04315 [Methanosarcina mazei]KKH01168.1 hypothetical protein DU68_05350 [Methanosarcina mazei]